ncbi:MAG: O-antigen ligase family protein [Phycisphaerae bacterium]|nr:O-antigen ligase family protein [Phycisphaerae bacterium]
MGELITLAVAGIGVVFVLIGRHTTGLTALCAVYVWVPRNLTVQVEGVDFSAPRIVVLVLIARLLFEGAHRRIRWSKLDWMVPLTLASFVCAAAIDQADAVLRVLIYHGGEAFDTVLPYFAFRMSVRTREDYFRLLRGLLVVSAPLGLFAPYQTLTGHNPYDALTVYASWFASNPESNFAMSRSGFYRAWLSFPEPITFGVFFAMIVPLTMPLWLRSNPARWWALPAAGGAVVGLIASLSSGPYMTLVFALAFYAAYRYRRYWRHAVISAVVVCAVVEFISNRRFYYVFVSRLSFNERNAYGRIWLIEEALTTGMTGHWLTGHGLVGRAGADSLEWENWDLVNHYVLVLARYGLVGLIPFAATLVLAFARLRRAMALARDEETRKLTWSVVASLAAMCFCIIGVGLFGQPLSFFYMLLAVAGSLPSVIAVDQRTRRRVRAPERRWSLPDRRAVPGTVFLPESRHYA